jgi:PKD repeat protein
MTSDVSEAGRGVARTLLVLAVTITLLGTAAVPAAVAAANATERVTLDFERPAPGLDAWTTDQRVTAYGPRVSFPSESAVVVRGSSPADPQGDWVVRSADDGTRLVLEFAEPQRFVSFYVRSVDTEGVYLDGTEPATIIDVRALDASRTEQVRFSRDSTLFDWERVTVSSSVPVTRIEVSAREEPEFLVLCVVGSPCLPAVDYATAVDAVEFEASTPTAAFEIDGRPAVGEATTFTAGATTAGTVVGYAWDFGDGATATGREATHAFRAAGDRQVSLTVTDEFGLEHVVTRTVTVLRGPEVRIEAATTAPNVDADVAFRAVAASESAVRSYEWTFGDDGTATGERVTYPFATPGEHVVTVRATDANGLVGTATLDVAVNGPPVPALSVATVDPEAGDPVTLDASESTDAEGPIAEYRWEFGDGSTLTTAEPTVTHPYAGAGTYTVRLTVVDAGGLTATTTAQVGVAAGFPWALVAAAVAVLVLLALVYWYLRRGGEEGWRDIVIDDVERGPDGSYLVLRNASERTYDLSGAVVVDDAGREYRFRDGTELEPGERERLLVHERFDLQPGRVVPFRTGGGEEYELPWSSVLPDADADERRPGSA